MGVAAHGRLLDVEILRQEGLLAEGVFDQVTQRQIVAGQAVPGVHFDHARVHALFQVLCLCLTRPEGFRKASMRDGVAQALGLALDDDTPGRMTYDLRRLRLHGLIERMAHSHRSQVTELGRRVALFFTKVHRRILRPGLSQLFDGCPKAPNHAVATALRRLDQARSNLLDAAKLTPCKI